MRLSLAFNRCMPQGSKKSVERFEFDEMLHNVNWLFLGARVLILLDLSYLSRFWTQARARAPTDQPSATMAATTLQAPLSPQCECEWLRPLCKPPMSPQCECESMVHHESTALRAPLRAPLLPVPPLPGEGAISPRRLGPASRGALVSPPDGPVPRLPMLAV